ncbi:MAG: DUF1847 domain-containing protein [Thermodesulfobacteriota bacterium]
MSDNRFPQCAKCSVKEPACRVPGGNAPEFCPTRNQAEIVTEALKEYARPEVSKFARMASLQEAECYADRHIRPYVLHPVKPRVQEVCEFAHKMEYKKLGLAHCAGLMSEARTLQQILEAQGFEVVSVCCKVGATPKETLGLTGDQIIRIGQFESMCSPIAQAAILNAAGCDFNVLVGLCVGHDSLFFKYAEAPTTVLIAKDRVTGHNPAAALYTTGSYYARLMRPGIDPPKQG